MISGQRNITQPQSGLNRGQNLTLKKISRFSEIIHELWQIWDWFHASWHHLVRPLKRPTNHCCVSLSKKISEATNRGQKRLKIKSDQKDQILKSYYEYHMWGLQKYQNHYEIPFGRGCIDLKNLAVLLLLAQCKSNHLSLFKDFNMAKYLKNHLFDLNQCK